MHWAFVASQDSILYLCIVPSAFGFFVRPNAEYREAPQCAMRPIPQGLRKLKVPLISIVDDDASVREATRALIRSLGYTAATFASAEEYLQSDCVESSSCVITDLQMPGMSGADLQDRLIADGHLLPIIMMTAFSEPRIRARVMQAGAIGFLSKPFSEESLIRCLEKALESRNPGIAEH